MSASVPRTSHLQPSPRPAPVIELAEFFARLPEARERTLRELAALDAETRSAFPGAWRLMAALLAQRQAMELGYDLTASSQEFSTLCGDVLHRRADAAAVVERFRLWLAPIRKA